MDSSWSVPSAHSDAVAAVARRVLAEDDVDADIVSAATVSPAAVGRGLLVAGANGVVAGMAAIRAVLDLIDPRIGLWAEVEDGSSVSAEQVLGQMAGPLRSLLAAQRSAEDLLGHLSGVATRTAAFVTAVAGTGCAIRASRRTTPGLRALEVAAVVAGGGQPPALTAGDDLLVTSIHAAAAGSLSAAVARARERAEGRRIRVEVASAAELDAAVAAGADLLVSNELRTEHLVGLVAHRREGVGLEVAGPVRLDQARQLALTGVDALVVDTLVSFAPPLPVRLELALAGEVALAAGPPAAETRED